jgi:Winged helix DNA-binding domain
MGGTERLSVRALNRATLDRQLLLRRAELPTVAAIRRVVALNAQESNSQYLSLWTRLEGFRIEHLTTEIESRTVVRSVTLRATQHVIAADDFGWLRSVLRPLLARVQRNVFGRRTAGVNLDELVTVTRDLLAGRSLTRSDLGRQLGERWPGFERGALAWSAQYLEPMLHPAPSGTWDVARRSTPCVLASDWLLTEEPPADEVALVQQLVRRYLGGYGPATAGDIRTWSGVSGLREIVDGMRGELRLFTDDSGRTLVDLPEAPRPDPDTPAPVRFLPDFDDLLLAFANRTRVMSDDIRRQVCVGDAVAATVLIDGAVAGTWSMTRGEGTTVMTVRPFSPWSPADCAAVVDEGTNLLAFVAAGGPDAAVHIEQ